ncbi:sorting nexin [Phytophthora cinnamomi]|uniref:sorting nexin n=1 Tax=Phytophthora cinnamomi TaxID=4785 RepID=UPI00355949FA|nr:sorting nexin [Phytophthora cinnamomi]
MPNSSTAGAPAHAEDHAAALWLELVDSSVECELCNEPYDDDGGASGHIPRLLACGHTYCQSCLDGWAQHGGASSGELAAIECPRAAA